MQLQLRKHKHGSFVIAVTFAFLAAISNIICFVSPYWIVSIAETNLGFLRLGLWEVCFENFIFPEDYVSKAYQGCWYIYYPEYKYILFWLNPPWFFGVQMLSIVSLTCNLAALLIIIMILCEVYGTKDREPHVLVGILQSIALGCFIVVTVAMGCMSKDRQWLPRPDLNMLSWSFAFAVLAGFFTIFCLFGLVTHWMSVQSRMIMQDPSLRQKLLGSESAYTSSQKPPGYMDGTGTESKFGAGTVPSLFTLPPSTLPGYYQGSQVGPASTLVAPSALSRGTVAPGAVGPTTAGTSAATVSAKLRETLEAQRAAVRAAEAQAMGSDLPLTGTMTSAEHAYGVPSSESIYAAHSRPDPRLQPGSSLIRPTGQRETASNIAMDSAV